MVSVHVNMGRSWICANSEDLDLLAWSSILLLQVRFCLGEGRRQRLVSESRQVLLPVLYYLFGRSLQCGQVSLISVRGFFTCDFYVSLVYLQKQVACLV